MQLLAGGRLEYGDKNQSNRRIVDLDFRERAGNWRLASGRMIESASEPKQPKTSQGDQPNSIVQLSWGEDRVAILKSTSFAASNLGEEASFSVFVSNFELEKGNSSTSLKILINGKQVELSKRVSPVEAPLGSVWSLISCEFVSEGKDEIEIHVAPSVWFEKLMASSYSLPNDVGVLGGTLIETVEGEKPVESLAPGDWILTLDAGFQPLSELFEHPKTDVEIVQLAAGSLGPECPHKLLSVVRDQKILVRDLKGSRENSRNEAFANACHFRILDEVWIKHRKQNPSMHFSLLFSDSHVVSANRVPVECHKVKFAEPLNKSYHSMNLSSCTGTGLRASRRTMKPSTIRAHIKRRQKQRIAIVPPFPPSAALNSSSNCRNSLHPRKKG